MPASTTTDPLRYSAGPCLTRAGSAPTEDSPIPGKGARVRFRVLLGSALSDLLVQIHEFALVRHDLRSGAARVVGRCPLHCRPLFCRGCSPPVWAVAAMGRTIGREDGASGHDDVDRGPGHGATGNFMVLRNGVQAAFLERPPVDRGSLVAGPHQWTASPYRGVTLDHAQDSSTHQEAVGVDRARSP